MAQGEKTMTLGFAHLKIVVVIVAAIVLYYLADVYKVPMEGVLLFTGIGAILAAAWDRLSGITA